MAKMDSIEQHLMNRVNAHIAKQLWQKMSTELEAPSGRLADEREKFPWMIKRAKELLKEYIGEKEIKDKI